MKVVNLNDRLISDISDKCEQRTKGVFTEISIDDNFRILGNIAMWVKSNVKSDIKRR